MKKTLLELVIDVLNVTDGDEVNSISDTVEALQAAKDIENVYFDIIGRKDWQFLRQLTALDSVSDSERPTHLSIPSHTSKMDFLNYNNRKAGQTRTFYRPVGFKFPDEFLIHVNARDDSQDNYDLITDYNGARFSIKNDSHPTFFTSFDDVYIVMDSYDSSVESTLMGQHTQASLFKTPQWSVDDNFTPELPEEVFPMFIAECMTFALLKKQDGLQQKTEQTAGRHARHLSQTHGVVQTGVRLPNYGRRSQKAGQTRRSPHFGPKS